MAVIRYNFKDQTKPNNNTQPITQAAQSVRNANMITPNAQQAAQAMTNNYSLPQSRTEQTLGRLSTLANAAPRQMETYQYNADQDQALQAALASARTQIAETQRNTNAGLRATGQGWSSYSETIANKIGAQGMENVYNNILPQLIQQDYNRFVDRQTFNRDAEQNQLSNLVSLFANQYQQDVTRPIDESSVTGYFMPSDARNAINSILSLKNQAEAKGVTAEQRDGLTSQADMFRQQLQSLGIDPSLYGADVNAATATRNGSQGIRTLQGQQVDLQNRQGNLNAANIVSNITGRAVTPQQDWGGLYRQAGDPSTPLTQDAINNQLNNALDMRRQDFNEGQQNWENNFALSEYQNRLSQQSLQNAWATAEQLGYVTPELSQLTGIPAGTTTLAAERMMAKQQQAPMTAEEYATSYLDRAVQRDPDTNQLLNSDSIEQAILASNLPEYEAYKLYKRYGIPWDAPAPSPNQQP